MDKACYLCGTNMVELKDYLSVKIDDKIVKTEYKYEVCKCPMCREQVVHASTIKLAIYETKKKIEKERTESEAGNI